MIFKYLGQVLITSDDNWPEVVSYHRKAWSRWAHLFRILGMDGEET